MTELQFQEILCNALNEEFKWVDSLDELGYEYNFSDEFKIKMHNLLKQAKKQCLEPEQGKEHTAFDYKFNKNFSARKIMISILVAILTIAMVACAVKIGVTWIENQNDEQGTLEVTFEVDKTKEADIQFKHKSPEMPKGFEIVLKEEDVLSTTMEYRNGNQTIFFDQTGGLENMVVSIDNETDEFYETLVNGQKGYISKKDDIVHLIWTDGISCFELIGNVDKKLLQEMAQTVK